MLPRHCSRLPRLAGQPADGDFEQVEAEVPATRAQRARVKMGTMLPWRRLMGERTVQRNVQGVNLHMPWSHVLPDYARARPTYGQNLVEIADALARRVRAGEEFAFVDIGANIGDSTLQVLNRVDGRALCIEGDAHWARYLRMNIAGDPRVSVEEVLLTTPELEAKAFATVRGLGTTAFRCVESHGGGANGNAKGISIEQLLGRNPAFGSARLIKSDTDGLDPLLVPAAARAWSSSRPVLFFEFDPALAREVAGSDANRVWEELAALGYSRVAVWDNTGDPLGQLALGQAAAEAAILEGSPADLGYSFWDVAVSHQDDGEAAEAFDELLSPDFHPRGAPQPS
jgi:FkbM family methyltransferase